MNPVRIQKMITATVARAITSVRTYTDLRNISGVLTG